MQEGRRKGQQAMNVHTTRWPLWVTGLLPGQGSLYLF